jgi:hypothetical protein
VCGTRELRLLTIDEVGFRPLDPMVSNLFLRLVAARHERGTIVLTSNKHVRDWPAIFAGHEILTTAILDRLIHHVHVLSIDGRSDRFRKLGVLLGPAPDGCPPSTSESRIRKVLMTPACGNLPVYQLRELGFLHNRAILAAHGMVPSTSRAGDCWDNAVAESPCATFKRELVRDAHWATGYEALRAIAEYIEACYNGSGGIRRSATRPRASSPISVRTNQVETST